MFMTLEQWEEIFFIARRNGLAVHELISQLNSEEPLADEMDIYWAARNFDDRMEVNA